VRRRICGALLGGLSQGKMSGWSAGVWVVGTVELGSVSGDGSIGDAGVVEGVGGRHGGRGQGRRAARGG